MSKGHYVYDYPRPMVTVDALVFTLREGGLDVLLIRRKHDPWLGMWACPGGFVDLDEPLDHAAARELREETGVTGVSLVQFHAFGAVDRDPRGRVITVAYLGAADYRGLAPCGADDAAEAAWLPVAGLPRLASDHNLVVATAVRTLRALLRDREAVPDWLPPTITKADLLEAVDALP